MAKFITDKKKITESILKIIEPEYSNQRLKECLFSWWKNPRHSGGLRLTDRGKSSFEAAEISYVDFDITLLSKLVLELDKKMISPYYFVSANSKFKIRVYDTRISMMITLYGGMNNYLKTLKDRKK